MQLQTDHTIICNLYRNCKHLILQSAINYSDVLGRLEQVDNPWKFAKPNTMTEMTFFCTVMSQGGCGFRSNTKGIFKKLMDEILYEKTIIMRLLYIVLKCTITHQRCTYDSNDPAVAASIIG